MIRIALTGALALALSSCAGVGLVATVAGPGEAIVAAERGEDSLFVTKVLEPVGDFACGLFGGSGQWSPDNGGTCQ